MTPARTWSQVTDAPIDASALVDRVGSSSDGAKILFTGVVRDYAEGRGVTGITYEAYREMAEAVLAEIVSEAAGALESGSVAAVHRTGSLGIGEVSVAIAVATPHRAEAYETSRRVIEEIKLRLPIWKHEHYSGGVAEWVSGTTPTAPATPRLRATAQTARP